MTTDIDKEYKRIFDKLSEVEEGYTRLQRLTIEEYFGIHAALFLRDSNRAKIENLLGERVSPMDTKALIIGAYRLGKSEGKSAPQAIKVPDILPVPAPDIPPLLKSILQPPVIIDIPAEPEKTPRRRGKRYSQADAPSHDA